MKILYIDPIPSLDSLGGSQISLLDIMTDMKQRGNRVLLASSTKGKLIEESRKRDIVCILFKLPQLKGIRIDIFSRTFINILAIVQNVISFLVAAYSLSKVIRTHRPTIVHSNEMLMAIPVGLASALTKTPSVAHIRWIPSDNIPQYIIKLYIYIVKRFNRVIIFNSRATQKRFIKNPTSQNYTVLYNGIRLEKIDHENSLIDSTLDLDKNKKTIGIFGRVIPIKGHHILIDALGILREKNMSLNLIIVGNAPNNNYSTELNRKIKQYELKNVYFLGFRNEIEDYIDIVDIVVAPSIVEESFGRTLVEGMALGKPIIASDIGAHLEIIDDGQNGFLVKQGDSKQLAEKISLSINSKNILERFGELGYEKYTSCFSLEKMMKKLNCIYDKALRMQN